MSELQADVMRMAIRAAFIFGVAWLALAYGVYESWDEFKDPKYLTLVLAGIGGGEGLAAVTKLFTGKKE